MNKLTLKVRTETFEIEDLKGVDRKYVLKELVGSERDIYLTDISGRMKYNAEGQPIGIRSFDGMQASLLALCLCDHENVLVPLKVLQTWPSTTLGKLFKDAQELSALNLTDDEDEDAKNV